MSLDTAAIKCFKEYMVFSVGKPPSKKELLLNIEAKQTDPNFTGDIEALLRPKTAFDQEDASELISYPSFCLLTKNNPSKSTT